MMNQEGIMEPSEIQTPDRRVEKDKDDYVKDMRGLALLNQLRHSEFFSRPISFAQLTSDSAVKVAILQLKYRDYFAMYQAAKNLNKTTLMIKCYEEWALTKLNHSEDSKANIAKAIKLRTQVLRSDL